MLNVIEVGCQVAGTAPTNVTQAAPGSVTSVVTTGPDGAPLDEGSQQSTLSNASAGMMSVLSAVNWLLTNMPFIWAFRVQILRVRTHQQSRVKFSPIKSSQTLESWVFTLTELSPIKSARVPVGF